MSIVQLPLAQSPIIGFQYVAYGLGITLNDKESLPWFYSNYIQLVKGNNFRFSMNFYPTWFNFNPFLDVQAFKKEIMKYGNINIHSFIKDCIDNQIYFYSSFDEFYVPHRISYGNRHFCHDFMIHGYDTAQQEYILIGYNEKQLYETTRISFAQFEEAFFSETAIIEYAHLLSRKVGYKYDFNPQLVYEMLEDYFYCRNTSERYSKFSDVLTDKYWGLDIYKGLREYFNLLISNIARYDIRPLHICYEHKKCMVSRLQYMNDYGYISDYSYLHESYKNLETKSIVMRNLQLKYSATHDNQYIDSIINILTEMERKEKELLEILLDKVGRSL